MSRRQAEKEKKEKKKEEAKKEEKVMRVKKPVLPLSISKKIVFQKVVHFKIVKAFLPIHAPRLKLTELHLSKLAVKPSRRMISKIIEVPAFILSKLFKIRISISKFSVVNSSKLAPIIISLIPSIRIRIPHIELHQVKPSKLHKPKLKSSPVMFPSSKILLTETVKIQAQPTLSPEIPKGIKETIQEIKTAPSKEEEIEKLESFPIGEAEEPEISKEALKEETLTLPEKIETASKQEIETKTISSDVEIGIGEGEAEENLLDEIFASRDEQIGSFDWSFGKMVCIVASGVGEDGIRMLEDILAKKYSYHGHFFLERDLDIKDVVKKLPLREGVSEMLAKDVVEKIVDDKPLIVSSILKKTDLVDFEITIKTLSDKAYGKDKCVLLYANEKDVDDLSLLKIYSNIRYKIPNATVRIVKLPKADQQNLKNIENMLGVDIKNLTAVGSIDMFYALALEKYEKRKRALSKTADEKLQLDQGGPLRYFYPSRESKSHYEMKKIVCWWLQKKYPNKRVEMEEDVGLTNPETKENIIPDINVNKKDFWEVEIGYPSSNELEENPEVRDPYVHLTSKLKKYPKGTEVNVVLPNIYAHLFKRIIRDVKRGLKSLKLKFYVIDWRKGICKRFL